MQQTGLQFWEVDLFEASHAQLPGHATHHLVDAHSQPLPAAQGTARHHSVQIVVWRSH